MTSSVALSTWVQLSLFNVSVTLRRTNPRRKHTIQTKDLEGSIYISGCLVQNSVCIYQIDSPFTRVGAAIQNAPWTAASLVFKQAVPAAVRML